MTPSTPWVKVRSIESTRQAEYYNLRTGELEYFAGSTDPNADPEPEPPPTAPPRRVYRPVIGSPPREDAAILRTQIVTALEPLVDLLVKIYRGRNR